MQQLFFLFALRALLLHLPFKAELPTYGHQDLHLLHLTFKAELPTYGHQDISFLVLNIYPEVKKLLQGYRAISSYLGLKILQFQPRKGNFLLYQYSKVIG